MVDERVLLPSFALVFPLPLLHSTFFPRVDHEHEKEIFTLESLPTTSPTQNNPLLLPSKNSKSSPLSLSFLLPSSPPPSPPSPTPSSSPPKPAEPSPTSPTTTRTQPLSPPSSLVSKPPVSSPPPPLPLLDEREELPRLLSRRLERIRRGREPRRRLLRILTLLSDLRART